jgi:hypothetical protein
MNTDRLWQERLFRSLRFKKEILDAVYQYLVSNGAELGRFLQDHNFYAKVCCALSWPIIMSTGTDMNGVKKELKNFLAKAENFKNEHNEYSPWWPDLDREGVVRQAYGNILISHSGSCLCFALIVSTVMETIEIIEIWEKPRGMMTR